MRTRRRASGSTERSLDSLDLYPNLINPARRDPAPHGPEIQAVSFTEIAFEGFKLGFEDSLADFQPGAATNVA
jgi:hypothetical protein